MAATWWVTFLRYHVCTICLDVSIFAPHLFDPFGCERIGQRSFGYRSIWTCSLLVLLLSPSFGDGVQVNGHGLEVVVISSQVFLGVVLFWNTSWWTFAGGAFRSLGMTSRLLPCRHILSSHLLLSSFCGLHRITASDFSDLFFQEAFIQIHDSSNRTLVEHFASGNLDRLVSFSSLSDRHSPLFSSIFHETRALERPTTSKQPSL